MEKEPTHRTGIIDTLLVADAMSQGTQYGQAVWTAIREERRL